MSDKKLRHDGSVLLVPAGTTWNASINTDAVDLKRCGGVSLCLLWGGGDGVFDFKLQSSAEGADSSVSDWIDIPDTAAAVSDGSPIRWDVENAVYRRIRVVATRTSGSLTGVQVRASTNDYPRTAQNDK